MAQRGERYGFGSCVLALAVLAACSQSSQATARGEPDGDAVRDADAARPPAVVLPMKPSPEVDLSRELELCGGTSAQIGWVAASESRGKLQLSAGGATLLLDGAVSTGVLALAGSYQPPGGEPSEVTLTGEASVVEGRDRDGNLDPSKWMLESRLLLADRWRVDVSSEMNASETSFDLSDPNTTRWRFCNPEGESCEWRVGMLECESAMATVGQVEADLGPAGNLSFEVRRAYLDLDNYSRVTRAWGTLDGIPFDVTDTARLLMDTQDVNGISERFVVLFEERRGEECGIELALAFDLQGPTAQTLDCSYQRVRALDVVDVTQLTAD